MKVLTYISTSDFSNTGSLEETPDYNSTMDDDSDDEDSDEQDADGGSFLPDGKCNHS